MSSRELVVAVVGAVEQPRLAHRTEQIGLDGIVLDRRHRTHPARHRRLGADRCVVHGVEGEAVATQPRAGDGGVPKAS